MQILDVVDDTTESKVLASSRVRGVLEGAQVVNIELPNDDDAVQMLLPYADLQLDEPPEAQRGQENKSSAVGGGPLAEMQRLTVCSADPTTPHQSGTSAMIPVHRCVGRELVRDAAPGRPLCAATGCGRCPSGRRRLFTNQFTPAR